MKRDCVIFGCGGFTKRRINEIEQVYTIRYVCDNDEKLWHKKWMEIYECISPNELLSIDNMEILVSIEKREPLLEIIAQLDRTGLKYKHINAALAANWLSNGLPVEERLQCMITDERKKIVLLGAPAHSNLGDQAQTYCIETMLKENMSDYSIYTFEGNPLRKDYFYLVYLLQNIIKEEDKILIHSGYHCTDLFQKEEDLNEKIVELFNYKQLLMLPQTVYFKSEDAKLQSQKVYNSHPNLTIMCRDKVSYELARVYYKKCRVKLFPDMVTSLIGRRDYLEKREGILLCLRGFENEESNIDKQKADQLIEELSKLNKVDVIDTNSSLRWMEIRDNRKCVIEDEIKKYASYKVVITDRYHGMIFSLIANTPVLVLPSTDHKLSSGVDWFPRELFKDIYLEEDINKIANDTREILDTGKISENPDYFYRQYFREMIKYLE